MNVVYLGTGAFGTPSLEGLVKSGHKVKCVVSQPDKPRNRGMRLEPAAMKQAAVELGLEVFQPDDINSAQSISYLNGLGSDLFVVIAYGQKLSQPVLDIPRLAAVNVHASLLPAYRGAAPVNWAIMRGEKTTGVTLMKLSSRMDAGPVILQKQIPILDSDTSLTLSQKMSFLAAEALIEGIGLIDKGKYALTEQDESKATYAPKLKKTDGLIDWNRPCADIVNQVRGCVPWPGAHTLYKGRNIKIHSASVMQDAPAGNETAGAIIGVSRNGIAVAAKPGVVLIHSLQMQGKRLVSAEEFIAGYRAKEGDVFG